MNTNTGSEERVVNLASVDELPVELVYHALGRHGCVLDRPLDPRSKVVSNNGRFGGKSRDADGVIPLPFLHPGQPWTGNRTECARPTQLLLLQQLLRQRVIEGPQKVFASCVDKVRWFDLFGMFGQSHIDVDNPTPSLTLCDFGFGGKVTHPSRDAIIEP